MRRILDSVMIGLGIASFCLVLNKVDQVVLTTLIMGAAQGLIVPLIYQERYRVPYLGKFLTHAALSYLLVLLTALSVKNLVPLWLLTVSWLIIFALVFVYFHFRNDREAAEINQKLEKAKRKEKL